MIIYFLQTFGKIQKGVKLETSLLAERRFEVLKDGGKNPLFDSLVLDEEDEVMFKRLFEQAHAELITGIPTRYLTSTPTDLKEVYREFADFSKDRDFALWLQVRDDFPLQYRKSIDIKVEQFLIDYICWRWLETKSPNDALGYQVRLADSLDDIKRSLNKGIVSLRRIPFGF